MLNALSNKVAMGEKPYQLSDTNPYPCRGKEYSGKCVAATLDMQLCPYARQMYMLLLQLGVALGPINCVAHCSCVAGKACKAAQLIVIASLS
jgi:hypothetical protein